MSRCTRFFAVFGSGTFLIRSTGSRPVANTPPSGSRSVLSSGCQVRPRAAAQNRPCTAGETASTQILTKDADGMLPNVAIRRLPVWAGPVGRPLQAGVGGGRLTERGAEVADEVRLVGVSERGGELGPVDRGAVADRLGGLEQPVPSQHPG